MIDDLELRGTYGLGTPCLVFAVRTRWGYWYAVEGSRNVNRTPIDLSDIPQPIDVETLPDDDYFYARAPIEDCDDLQRELDE